MTYNLYLDDNREPHMSVKDHGQWYIETEWEIARSYQEFCEMLDTRGLPNIVSFDHDLNAPLVGESPGGLVLASEGSYEDNGSKCASYLIEKCIEADCDPPKWFVHSANPVGGANINSKMNSYLKYRNLA